MVVAVVAVVAATMMMIPNTKMSLTKKGGVKKTKIKSRIDCETR